MKGRVHSFESFAASDGPGIRFSIFLSGCPMRCVYCHNPDTWDRSGGSEYSADEIVKKVLRFKPYFKNGGGVTISGGEPLMQAEFLTELLKNLKKESIHTAVDTSGFYLNDSVKEALLYTDLVILDIKHTDAEGFKKITKQENKNLLRFLDYMKEIQKPLWIRQVIVPGLTDSEEQINKLKETVKGANVLRIELLPYHTLGVFKWENLKIPYELKDVSPPTDEKMQTLRKIIDE